MSKCQTGAGTVILGVILVLSVFAISVARHPESMGGAGSSFLVMNVVLVLVGGGLGIWALLQRSPKVSIGLNVGALAGLVLGLVHIAHHSIEFLLPQRGRTVSLLVGAGHMLLIFAFFSVVGSLAWERTRSAGLAITAAVWAAVLSVLMLIAYAFSLNLVFESRAELGLQEAFQASGMSEPGAFLVKNSLEAASEGLVRMPILALLMGLAGALANAWMSHWSRKAALLVACVVPLVFVAGAVSLWYADSLERASRPPFVMAGLLSAGVSLAGIHALWSTLRRSRVRAAG